MGKMNGKGEGTRAKTQHIRGTKRTTQVDWELSGRGKVNLKENEKQRVAIKGTASWGTKSCLEREVELPRGLTA